MLQEQCPVLPPPQPTHLLRGAVPSLHHNRHTFSEEHCPPSTTTNTPSQRITALPPPQPTHLLRGRSSALPPPQPTHLLRGAVPVLPVRGHGRPAGWPRRLCTLLAVLGTNNDAVQAVAQDHGEAACCCRAKVKEQEGRITAREGGSVKVKQKGRIGSWHKW